MTAELRPQYTEAKKGMSTLVSQMRELNQTREQLDAQIKEQVKTLEAARKAALLEILEKGGLGCCSHKDHKYRVETDDAEEAGLVQVEQLTHWYRSRTWYSRGDHYGSASSGRTTDIVVLCPAHLGNPSVKDSEVPPGVDIECKVIKKGDRFFTEINNIDVTELMPPVNPGEHIYQYFGFDPLPKLEDALA